MASQDGETASSNATIQFEGSQARRCPFCDQTGDGKSEIYRHLMINHRKSELSRGLLALVEGDDKEIGESDTGPEMLSGDLI